MKEKIHLAQGDLTKLTTEAVVNAANSSLLGGGGVDGAIHHSAGSGLLDECRTLGGCETGDAKITKGHLLPARYVIHTVGPVYRGGYSGEALKLASCYRRCFEVAADHSVFSLAFPSISTGAYGYPIDEACRIALTVSLEQLGRFPQINRAVFVTFSGKDLLVYAKQLAAL